MAVALLGYFTAMVTAFFGFMFLLSSVLSSSFVQQAHMRRPYPTPAVVATATVPDERPPAISAEQLARAEMARQSKEEAAAKEAAKETTKDTTKAAAAETSKRAKVAARSQRRRQDFAGRQQDRDYPRQQGREYSMALGYAQDGQRQYGGGQFGGGFGGMFGQFGTRRF